MRRSFTCLESSAGQTADADERCAEHWSNWTVERVDRHGSRGEKPDGSAERGAVGVRAVNPRKSGDQTPSGPTRDDAADDAAGEERTVAERGADDRAHECAQTA